MELVNTILARLKAELAKEAQTGSFGIGMVIFGPEVRIFAPAPSDEFNPPQLSASGPCPLAEAMEEALVMVEEIKKICRTENRNCAAPKIILLSAGQATDLEPESERALGLARRICEGEKAGRFSFYTLAISPADPGLLKSLTPPNRPPLLVEKDIVSQKFLDLFLWVMDDFLAPATEKECRRDSAKAALGASQKPLKPPYIFGASIKGPDHIKAGLACQDACAFEVLNEERVAFAVADGLGSAARSELGAELAVKAAVSEFKKISGEERGIEVSLEHLARSAVAAARKALERAAGEKGLSLNELACTIMAGVARQGSMAVAHIGDGGAVAQTDDGLQIISAPAQSEYVNEVVPLTSQDYENALRISSLTGIKALAAFTDGCQRAGLKKSPEGLEPHAKFFEPIFSWAMQEVEDPGLAGREIAGLLASDKLAAISEDDKTLVIAVLRKAD